MIIQNPTYESSLSLRVAFRAVNEKATTFTTRAMTKRMIPIRNKTL